MRREVGANYREEGAHPENWIVSAYQKSNPDVTGYSVEVSPTEAENLKLWLNPKLNALKEHQTTP